MSLRWLWLGQDEIEEDGSGEYDPPYDVQLLESGEAW